MSATPSFWYPILSTGFSRQNRFIRVTAVLKIFQSTMYKNYIIVRMGSKRKSVLYLLTFLGTVIWSKPLRMML